MQSGLARISYKTAEVQVTKSLAKKTAKRKVVKKKATRKKKRKTKKRSFFENLK